MIKIAFVVRIDKPFRFRLILLMNIFRFALQPMLLLKPRLTLLSCMEDMAMVLVLAMLDLAMVLVWAMLVLVMVLDLAMELVWAMLVLAMVLLLPLLPDTVSPMLPTP